MTRARSELALTPAGALSLVIFLAWYQGRQQVPGPASPMPVSGTVLRTTPAALDSPQVTNIPITAPVTPAAELPPAELASDRAFINEAFPALSSWSVEEVKPLLSTEALNASSDAELNEVMATLDARLGTLQYFDSPQPIETSDALAADNGAELQPYTFTAYYEAGEAQVNLVLEKEQQRSSLYSFDINVQN
jgi:hypothetical protein